MVGNVTAIQDALRRDPADVLTMYAISQADAAGPFLPSIPSDLMEQASLPGLFLHLPRSS